MKISLGDMRHHSLVASVAFILMMIFSAAVLWPVLPDNMATHWGLDNAPDAYTEKFAFVSTYILLAVAIFALLAVIPKIDPLKKNYEYFKKQYDIFRAFLLGFLAYIFGLTIAENIGYSIDMELLTIPAIAVLFYFAAVLVENSKQNWFVGIRTPWTLSSKSVWEKT
ncbi:MAG: DUF1648 domain-containing protein, partial [Candidatus Diapherotrites archaeon]|nr:DUF1648 domain-containing protein [Candidatus Diapherotrites archaeon]